MDEDGNPDLFQRLSGAASKELIQIDPQTIIYGSDEADQYPLRLDEALDDALTCTTLNSTPLGRKAVSFFRTHNQFLIQFYSQLFWLVHMSIYEPNRLAEIEPLLATIGRSWVEFIFPIESAGGHNPTLDEFLRVFPFITTQVFQFSYMSITHVHRTTISKEFQRSVCACLLNLFTSVEPVESLIWNTMSSMFPRLPNVDIPDMPKQAITTLTLPIEDLSTLTGMQRRVRAAPVRWRSSAVSPIVAAGTGQKVTPYDRDTSISFSYPRGGEQDWKSRLPPLSPPKRIPRRMLTKENYDPSKETRSLILRAKRTNIGKRLQEIKDTQAKIQEQMEAEYRRRQKRTEKVENAIFGASQKELSDFVTSLRGKDKFQKPQRQFDDLENVDLRTLIEKF